MELFRAPMHFLKCLEMITSDTAWDHKVICILLSLAENVRERFFVTLIFSGFNSNIMSQSFCANRTLRPIICSPTQQIYLLTAILLSRV